MIERWQKWFREWQCEHYWRPGRYRPAHPGARSELVKVCDYCDKQVSLSDAEFYALFGRWAEREPGAIKLPRQEK